MSVELNPLALEALENNQRHLDMDGVEVGVSRQALDELITAYKALATQPAREAQEPVAVIRFAHGEPGEHNEMPKVVSCNWQPDGEYPVFLTPPDAADTIERLTGERDEARVVRSTYDDLLRAHGILQSQHRERQAFGGQQLARAERAEADLAELRKAGSK